MKLILNCNFRTIFVKNKSKKNMFVELGSQTDKMIVINIHDYECNKCKKIGSTKLIVTSNYFEIMWLPIFPLGKEGIIICDSCKTTANEFLVSKSLKELIEKTKNEIKYSWYNFTGLFIGILFIIFLLILMGL